MPCFCLGNFCDETLLLQPLRDPLSNFSALLSFTLNLMITNECKINYEREEAAKNREAKLVQ